MNINVLLGLTMKEVINHGNEELIFTTTDGRIFKFFHEQSCCEDVSIESIVGDLNDLVNEPILLTEVITSDDKHPEDYSTDKEYESFKWTFYKFATRKGYVDIRWFGSSNGYYSERVSFEEVLE